MEKEDLLNLNNNNKQNIKKPLIIGAGIFIIFVVGVIAFGLISNKKEDNVVNPPKQDTIFKEVPIEEKPAEEKPESIAKKLLKNENKTQTPKVTTQPTQQEKTAPQPVKKEKIEPTPKPQPQKTKKQTLNQKYYIQVAALMKNTKPNPRFLKIIEKNGFKYKIITVNIKKGNKTLKVTKVLIGPFDKKDAKEKLKIVKAKINQNAFIFRIKE